MTSEEFVDAMQAAINNGDASHVRSGFRQQPGMITYDDNGSWLHTAVSAGQHALIPLLVKLGCPLESKDILDQTALNEAIRRDDLECVRALLQAGADPNLEGTRYPATALCSAVKHKLDILRLLDQHGADFTRHEEIGGKQVTALFWANDDGEEAKFLRSRGCPETRLEPVRAAARPAKRAGKQAGKPTGPVGPWRAAVLRSVGPDADVKDASKLEFGPPATPEELETLEQALGAKLPQELKSLLAEFNGVWIVEGKSSEPWFLSTEAMPAASHFYDDWDSELATKLCPKVAFVCQENGMSELWGVVLKAFKPYKRGDIVALDHDMVIAAESADELFSQPYASLLELVEAQRKINECG